MSNIDSKILDTKIHKEHNSVLDNQNFMQILNYLDVLKSTEKGLNLAKLNGRLSEVLNQDEHERALLGAKNLDELLKVVKNFNLDLDNLRVESLMDLRSIFPNLAKSNFI